MTNAITSAIQGATTVPARSTRSHTGPSSPG